MKRREFLTDVAAGGLALGLAGQLVQAAEGEGQARVVCVHSAGAAALAGAERVARIERMLAAGLAKLTGQSGAAAWRTFVSPADIVGLKVNALAARRPTSPELAEAVAKGVQSAGVPGEHCLVFDRSTRELTGAGYTMGPQPAGHRVVATDQPAYGWEPQALTSGTATQQVSTIVTRHVSVLINLPVLKDHNVCGVTGALKNHCGSIRQPHLLHPANGNPYFADAAALPPFVQKQRLVISDALTIIFEGGPGDRPDCRYVYDSLLLATDPVAHDVIAWQMIEQVRAAKGLRPLARVGRPTTYLTAAAERKLGVGDLTKIRVERVEVS